ncbi:hypothetical protein P154DRAFT_523145 [Amniculicola lignicola CBS 123094]|uniref:DUF7137 domain-containing protein n=1 Tax=Amniculicola lignicola CBS 123094 TaxID=1392246 RepID=A0A6A5WHK0_9PLEO|nr:hypothetical protein P154DRAFT_523145 [Amniculicola lignicola CBS 123094]
MRPSQILAAVVALASVSSAIDVFGNEMAIGNAGEMLFGRQDNNNNDQSSSVEEKSSARDESSSAKETAKETSNNSDDSKPTSSGKDSVSKTTGKPTSGSQKASATKSAKTVFDPRLPAGGIQMVTPAPIAGAQFYKIGEWVTFAWNYTSLSVTPSAIDILATCSANSATYTLAVNQSTEATGRVLWDTGAYQKTATVPLLTETYTLMIYDSDLSVSATARAGYLAVFNSYTFGMYTPQPYTPWADYKCAGCSGALSAFEKLTLKALLITGGTTMFSLLYFSYNFGMW